MNNELQRALRRMGYRPMPCAGESETNSTRWVKPVGYSAFTVSYSPVEGRGLEWGQYFMSQLGEVACWTIKNWPEHLDVEKARPVMDHYVAWLKECENWDQKAPICGTILGNFDFMPLSAVLNDR